MITVNIDYSNDLIHYFPADKNSRNRSRMTSAGRSGRVSGGVWPPNIKPPQQRSITPAGDFYGRVPNTLHVDPKGIQRPKTVSDFLLIIILSN